MVGGGRKEDEEEQDEGKRSRGMENGGKGHA